METVCWLYCGATIEPSLRRICLRRRRRWGAGGRAAGAARRAGKERVAGVSSCVWGAFNCRLKLPICRHAVVDIVTLKNNLDGRAFLMTTLAAKTEHVRRELFIFARQMKIWPSPGNRDTTLHEVVTMEETRGDGDIDDGDGRGGMKPERAFLFYRKSATAGSLGALQQYNILSISALISLRRVHRGSMTINCIMFARAITRRLNINRLRASSARAIVIAWHLNGDSRPRLSMARQNVD